jgi:hypothetical protein
MPRGLTPFSKVVLVLFASVGVAFAQDQPQPKSLIIVDGAIEERLISEKDKKVLVSVKNADCKYKDIQIEEKERNSRFYEDLRSVIGKFGGAEKSATGTKCPDLEKTHEQQYPRSTLTVTAVAASGEKENVSRTIVAGPKEHLYLGIDLPVTQRKTLKYDNSTRTLQPNGDSPQLYLSVNYMLGDVLTSEDAKDPKTKKYVRPALDWERLSVKAMVLASKRPLDSFGIGIGYQVPKIDWLGLDLSSTSIFLGRFWTKQDAIADDGSGLTNASTQRAWRIGITYDVGAGLKWLNTK